MNGGDVMDMALDEILQVVDTEAGSDYKLERFWPISKIYWRLFIIALCDNLDALPFGSIARITLSAIWKFIVLITQKRKDNRGGRRRGGAANGAGKPNNRAGARSGDNRPSPQIKGSATVIFNKHGDASKAFAEYNNRTLDERPMKIELIVNPGAPALRLGPATGTANSHRNSGSGGVTKTRGPARASGGGRGGRRAPKKPVTAADLDAEMDMYIAAPVSALIRPEVNILANALA
ncbi:hypothetical protein BSLG_005780 [Batrachochytrium salamandrivorans]|nr:hypothetical protein BSLG_005780 [Batrachochytrium salamandrivorans]